MQFLMSLPKRMLPYKAIRYTIAFLLFSRNNKLLLAFAVLLACAISFKAGPWDKSVLYIITVVGSADVVGA